MKQLSSNSSLIYRESITEGIFGYISHFPVLQNPYENFLSAVNISYCYDSSEKYAQFCLLETVTCVTHYVS